MAFVVIIVAWWCMPLVFLLGTIASFAYIKANHTAKKWLYAIPAVLLVVTIASFIYSLEFVGYLRATVQ